MRQKTMVGVCLKYEQLNYGSKLQALATVRMLEDLGLEYEIIQYNKKTPAFLMKSALRLFNYVFLCDRYYQLQRKFEFSRHPQVKAQVEIRNRAFSDYNEHFNAHLSEYFSSYGDLKKKCSKRYDALLTCSDQLWSPSALGSGFYNLMFAPADTLQVSWASSFGVGSIPWYQRTRTRTYLNRIHHISMRENQGADIVRELTGREVPVLMDPVFAFSREQWDDMVPGGEPEWDDYIFCYFLGDNPGYRRAARELAEKTGRKIVTLRHLDKYVDSDEAFGDYAPYDVDPVRFLNILRNASCVCTDSFHGTAFALIYEKPFVVFDRYSNSSANSKNSRIQSVCDNLGVTNRRYRDGMVLADMLAQAIDYVSVGKKIEGYRSQTIKYLQDAFGCVPCRNMMD
jgi:hypothetical protein